jgi:hypothetical protein
MSLSRVELLELSRHVDMAPGMSTIGRWAKIIINNIFYGKKNEIIQIWHQISTLCDKLAAKLY